MKLKLNFKSLLILFLLTCVSTVTISTTLNAAPVLDMERAYDECSGNGGTLTQITGTTDCEVTPDVQKITFYSLHMCQSKPTAPTPSATVDLSDCQTFYKDVDGNAAQVINGTASIIGSREDYSAIKNATYSYAVVTMGSIFTFKGVLNFSGTMKDGEDGEDGSSTSTRCVTQTSTNEPIYGMETDARLNDAAEKNIICSATAVAEEAQVGVNILTPDSEGDCYHTATFPSSSGTSIEAYLVTADETLNDNVQTSGANIDRVVAGATGCKAGESGGITKIVGIMPINLNVNTDTTGLRMKFNNTRALSIDMSSTDNVIYKLDSAFFDFDLTTVGG
jgi:hypothetical protein